MSNYGFGSKDRIENLFEKYQVAEINVKKQLVDDIYKNIIKEFGGYMEEADVNKIKNDLYKNLVYGLKERKDKYIDIVDRKIATLKALVNFLEDVKENKISK